jgi:hypothetical protein
MCKFKLNELKGEIKMKRLIIALSFVVALGISANAQNYNYFDAQSDGFFSVNSDNLEYRYSTQTFPALPGQNIYKDQAAPVGSGLLLLAGMGAAYALRKKRK